MKQIILIAVAMLFTITTFSQTVIENPKTGMSTASNLRIEKIELTDTATVLWFHVDYKPGWWISIPKKSFIQPVGSDEKLYVDMTDGIPLSERYTMPESGKVSYKLYFPAIDASTAKLDFGEANDGGSWFIYDIQLKPELFKSIIPDELAGNWFRSDNAEWEISLFDSTAVYKSQVWKYVNYAEEGKLGKIEAKSGAKTLNLYTRSLNDSTCLLGETPEAMVKYSSQPDESVVPSETDTFEEPVFKMGEVTLSGYIKNFSPRYSQRTGMIYLNNVLLGNQESHIVKINDDGTFEAKFAMANPQVVLLRSSFSTDPVFLKPGGNTFQLINNGSESNPVLFSGDCARVNTDLLKLKHIDSYNYQEMQNRILDSSPEQFADWCQGLLEKDLTALDSFANEYPISDKAKKLKALSLIYRYNEIKLGYEMSAVSAWRMKNKIPRDQRQIDFEPEKPDTSYYDFLTNDLVNNPLAVLTSEYYFFINRLKYLEILRGSRTRFSTSEIIDGLEKSGYKFNSEELELAEKIKEAETLEVLGLHKEYLDEFGGQLINFHMKYREKLQPMFDEKEGQAITYKMQGEYLKDQNVELTDAEEAFLVATDEHNNNPLIKERNRIQGEVKEEISKFYSDHRSFMSSLHQQRTREARNEKIHSILGFDQGLATDIMTSQDYCRPIVQEMTPVSGEKLKEIQQQINDPFIANYIGLMNENTMAKIEENKTLAGATLNEVPKTEADHVFDAIIEKYKGKVVYVDFWATWCGPCRSGIERIRPLKEEMEGENVVFVYITNQTSPKGTYDNMIPTIKGEHYRVSADEWNFLKDKFQISGIPHYTLVGKDGNVINPHLAHFSNPQLKSLLMKHIND